MLGLWNVITGIITLSLIYSSISIYSILGKLGSRVWIDVKHVDDCKLPKVTVILPFYREMPEHIEMTFRSLVLQSYPKDLVDVYIILERGDVETINYVGNLKYILEHGGFRTYVVINQNSRRSKASAINSVLNKIDGDVVIIYDAGDVVSDRYHIAKVVKLVEMGYDVIGSKVYRVSNNLLGKLSLMDTMLWYNVALPGLVALTGFPLVSGEGMAVSRSFMVRANGLPDKLTEDSYLTILVAKYGCKIALLNSVIYEGAPKNVKGLIKQRLRWYRGYIECLKDLVLHHSRELKADDVVKLVIVYMQPLALLSLPMAVMVLILSPLTYVDACAFYASLITVITMILAPLYVLVELNVKDVSALAAPIYWIFQGLIVLMALMPIRIKWLRTERNFLEVKSITSSTLSARSMNEHVLS